MLYQKTIKNICENSKSREEIKEKLKEKNLPFEECDNKDIVNTKGDVIGKVIISIDLGKIDESFYGDDYYGFEICEMYKPFTYFFYSKLES